MFHYLYYSVKNNEFREKFRIVLCCFSAIENIVAPSSSSNLPKKLFFLLVFVCLHQSMPISL